MNAQKIVYVTPALPVGGAERFLLALSASLRNDTAAQWIVSLSSNNILESEVAPGVQFLAWPRHSKFDRRPVQNLRQLISTEKPDVVFCINFFAYFIVRAALRGSGQRPRVMVSYHSTKHLTRKEHWLHHLYIRMLRKSDEVICVSAKQADYTANTYPIARHKLQVVLNGVDTGYWKPWSDPAARNQLREQLGIPVNARVIILTAGFRPEKNHLGAVRILKSLHESGYPGIYLLFVGDGVMRPQIEAAIRESNMGEFIKLAGLQRNVLPYYQAADVFTLVSDSVETFSIAALEAMACGLPLILTNIGGAGEMVQPGINGFLTECDDESIARGWKLGLDQAFDRMKIREHAVAHFDLPIMLSHYKKLLEVKA
ncbi:MAG: glycosyltransferase [Chitinophagaceae bacterium]